jgi:hypothetical protein
MALKMDPMTLWFDLGELRTFSTSTRRKTWDRKGRWVARALRACLPPIFALVFRAASLRYRISCEYFYSETMALLLFGGLHSSQGNWFGLRCSWLLFHRCCRTLRAFATEAVGKLAAIIRVNLGVVLSSRNRHIGEAVVNQEFAFLGVHVD